MHSNTIADVHLETPNLGLIQTAKFEQSRSPSKFCVDSKIKWILALKNNETNARKQWKTYKTNSLQKIQVDGQKNGRTTNAPNTKTKNIEIIKKISYLKILPEIQITRRRKPKRQ